MTNEGRRRASRSTTRRERRSGVTRTYTSTSTPVAQPTATLRRSYMAEPTPMDYTQEYRFVRKDLLRILLWASILIGAMVIAAVLNLPALLF
jgi:hypothetical protein